MNASHGKEIAKLHQVIQQRQSALNRASGLRAQLGTRIEQMWQVTASEQIQTAERIAALVEGCSDLEKRNQKVQDNLAQVRNDIKLLRHKGVHRSPMASPSNTETSATSSATSPRYASQALCEERLAIKDALEAFAEEVVSMFQETVEVRTQELLSESERCLLKTRNLVSYKILQTQTETALTQRQATTLIQARAFIVSYAEALQQASTWERRATSVEEGCQKYAEEGRLICKRFLDLRSAVGLWCSSLENNCAG